MTLDPGTRLGPYEVESAVSTGARVAYAASTTITRNRSTSNIQFGISPAEVAAALNVNLSDLEQWARGELRRETADIIEVGISLLACACASPRLSRAEPSVAHE